ncbi:hypothetical protein PoB_007272900 [Plakobranchus ocellatus]|uniref:Uncharacterized protein n=1 Tax=Plakobranchus ocellatus TaxID=259542 RepID=A0AAV4DPT1_9GAST|nr:hypothetical protein PoB_007272900 [Plakobranchus ocellatus]
MQSRNRTRIFLPPVLLLVLLLHSTVCDGLSASETENYPTVQALLGRDIGDAPEIEFPGNVRLAYDLTLLNSFFQCLCNNTTIDCYVHYEAIGKIATGSTRQAYRVTRVESTHSSLDKDAGQLDSRQEFASYECTPPMRRSKTSTCQRSSNDASIATPPLKEDFHDACDFKCVNIDWSSDVKYRNFGKRHSESDVGFCVHSSEADHSNKKLNDKTLGQGDGNSSEDINNGNKDEINGVSSMEMYTQANTTLANLEATNDTAHPVRDSTQKSSGENVGTGTEGKKDAIEKDCRGHKKDLKYLGIGLAVSVILNFALLIACIYLCTNTKRKISRRLSTLSKPGSGSGKEINPLALENLQAKYRGSINMAYQDVEEDEVLATGNKPENSASSPPKRDSTYSSPYIDEDSCDAAISDSHNDASDMYSGKHRPGNAAGASCQDKAPPGGFPSTAVYDGYTPPRAMTQKPMFFRSRSDEPFNRKPEPERYPKSPVLAAKYSSRPKLDIPSRKGVIQKAVAAASGLAKHQDKSTDQEDRADFTQTASANPNDTAGNPANPDTSGARVKPQPRKPRRSLQDGTETNVYSNDADPQQGKKEPRKQSNDSTGDSIYEPIAISTFHDPPPHPGNDDSASSSQNDNSHNSYGDRQSGVYVNYP